MTRVEPANGWIQILDAELAKGLTELFEDHLGPAILGDAQEYCPVDTARLVTSLDMQVRDDDRLPVLEVGSFPDAEGEVPYAAAVELGFHGPESVRGFTRNVHGREQVVRPFERIGNVPEQPYLRPALYQERDS